MMDTGVDRQDCCPYCGAPYMSLLKPGDPPDSRYCPSCKLTTAQALLLVSQPKPPVEETLELQLTPEDKRAQRGKIRGMAPRGPGARHPALYQPSKLTPKHNDPKPVFQFIKKTAPPPSSTEEAQTQPQDLPPASNNDIPASQQPEQAAKAPQSATDATKPWVRFRTTSLSPGHGSDTKNLVIGVIGLLVLAAVGILAYQMGKPTLEKSIEAAVKDLPTHDDINPAPPKKEPKKVYHPSKKTPAKAILPVPAGPPSHLPEGGVATGLATDKAGRAAIQNQSPDTVTPAAIPPPVAVAPAPPAASPPPAPPAPSAAVAPAPPAASPPPAAVAPAPPATNPLAVITMQERNKADDLVDDEDPGLKKIVPRKPKPAESKVQTANAEPQVAPVPIPATAPDDEPPPDMKSVLGLKKKGKEPATKMETPKAPEQAPAPVTVTATEPVVLPFDFEKLDGGQDKNYTSMLDSVLPGWHVKDINATNSSTSATLRKRDGVLAVSPINDVLPAQLKATIAVPPKCKACLAFEVASRDNAHEWLLSISLSNTPVYQKVSIRTRDPDAWQNVVVDLSAWAGKRVDVLMEIAMKPNTPAKVLREQVGYFRNIRLEWPGKKQAPPPKAEPPPPAEEPKRPPPVEEPARTQPAEELEQVAACRRTCEIAILTCSWRMQTRPQPESVRRPPAGSTPGNWHILADGLPR